MKGIDTPNKKPKLAGIAEVDLPTNETDLPHNYFAGVRSLPVSWIMEPIITFTRPTPDGQGAKK